MNPLKLKSVMVEQGMTQKKLLSLTGLSSTTYNRRMKDGSFTIPEAQRIINALHITNPGEIFFDKPGT